MNTLKPRIASLLQQLNERVFEKEHIVALALLSAVAGESIFLLGPPGVAKSMVGRRLKLAFRNASAFEYLMSRFSTPDEIFGPVSISKLKDEDTYERSAFCHHCFPGRDMESRTGHSECIAHHYQ